MMTALRPDPVQRNQIESGARPSSFMCWTCGSCDFECPVNIATGCLRPQKLVRMANLGFLDELLDLPEIWYCLTCRRCLQICPNEVKPVVLIEHLRKETVRQGLYGVDTLRKFKDLSRRFQRVRWHATAECLQGKTLDLSDTTWNEWLEKPVTETDHVIDSMALASASEEFSSKVATSRTAACFTCGECSSACPVSCERSIFEPRTIFRSANLGLMKDLFLSPSIWLCISCGRCTDACSQLVDGKTMIATIQKMALDSSAVDRSFPYRLEKTEKVLYARFLREIDSLFGFVRPHSSENETGVKPAAACV